MESKRQGDKAGRSTAAGEDEDTLLIDDEELAIMERAAKAGKPFPAKEIEELDRRREEAGDEPGG